MPWLALAGAFLAGVIATLAFMWWISGFVMPPRTNVLCDYEPSVD